MPIPERRSMAAYLAVLVVVLAIGTLYLRSQRNSQGHMLPEFPPWQPDASGIEKQNSLDERRRGGLEARLVDKSLLKALADFHRIEIETQADAQMRAYREATDSYRLRAERYVRDYGRERYAQLGLEQRAQFLDALKTLTSAAENKGRTLAGQVAHAPDREELHLIRGLGGGFLDFAVQRGLISEHGDMDEAHQFLIGILFKVRWHRWVQNIDPVNANLTRMERRTLLRYQVSVPPVMTLGRRIRHLKDLAALDPTYPFEMVQAIVLIRSGRINEARLVVTHALRNKPADQALMEIQGFLDRVIVEYSQRGAR
jgi:hypothetical protein